MTLEAGQIFAEYTIVRRLGAGGMGAVYLAQHPRLPRQDALKLLTADVSGEGNFRERFLNEADHTATLSHPHIVGVYDRGECDGQLWISMAFVDGEDAGSLIKHRYPDGMPPDLVCEIIGAIADALDYAHRQGLLHRDVKPANILLANVDNVRQRRILLTDFGIARSTGGQSHLTKTNMTIGTVDYASPQQLMGEQDLDGRTDQYSLAVTAYELLTGKPPFRDENPAVVIGRQLSAEVPALRGSRPELAELDPVLATALAKDPGQRFADCGEFARALATQVYQDSAAATRAAPRTPAAGQGGGRAPGWYPAPDGNPSYWDGQGWHSPPRIPQPSAGRPWVLLGVVGVVVAIIAVVLVVVLTTGGSGTVRESTATAVAPTTTRVYAERPPPSSAVPPPEQPQRTSWPGVMVGTCDEGGTCGVKQRSAPYNAAPARYPDPLLDGAAVFVVCQTVGDLRSNQGRGSSDIWYRLDTGVYVNSVYVSVFGLEIPTC